MLFAIQHATQQRRRAVLSSARFAPSALLGFCAGALALCGAIGCGSGEHLDSTSSVKNATAASSVANTPG
ncbi:MAG: hypothetical protein ACR2KM_08330, partial [Gemmatimonadaceae bacterium]